MVKVKVLYYSGYGFVKEFPTIEEATTFCAYEGDLLSNWEILEDTNSKSVIKRLEIQKKPRVEIG